MSRKHSRREKQLYNHGYDNSLFCGGNVSQQEREEEKLMTQRLEPKPTGEDLWKQQVVSHRVERNDALKQLLLDYESGQKTTMIRGRERGLTAAFCCQLVSQGRAMSIQQEQLWTHIPALTEDLQQYIFSFLPADKPLLGPIRPGIYVGVRVCGAASAFLSDFREADKYHLLVVPPDGRLDMLTHCQYGSLWEWNLDGTASSSCSDDELELLNDFVQEEMRSIEPPEPGYPLDYGHEWLVHKGALLRKRMPADWFDPFNGCYYYRDDYYYFGPDNYCNGANNASAGSLGAMVVVHDGDGDGDGDENKANEEEDQGDGDGNIAMIFGDTKCAVTILSDVPDYWRFRGGISKEMMILKCKGISTQMTMAFQLVYPYV